MEYIEEEIEEEEDSGGGWLTTWADMMSVLLTFFIVLQAFSTISEKKFYEAMASIRQALTFSLIRAPGNAQYEARTDEALELQEHIANQNLDGVAVSDYGDRLVLTVESGVLFPIGKADLSGAGRELMDGIADVLAGTKGTIRIEGHTCDLPVGRHSEFENNWWLSNARALRVLEALEQRGFPPERLAAAGYGEYRPVAPNDVEENRAKNRRVEFIIEKSPPRAD